jgi:hypothetical protein
MFKINIHSQKEGYFWLEKTTQAEVDEYLAWAAESAHWGRPQWIEQIEAVEEVLDEAGVVITPAQAAYQIIHPAEYEIIVEDITAQVAAEQAQIDAVKAAQQQAAIRLFSFPQQVDACQDLEALKAAIKVMVSDIAMLLMKEGK